MMKVGEPVIIPIIFFCILKICTLCEEFPHNMNPEFIIQSKQAQQTILSVSCDIKGVTYLTA